MQVVSLDESFFSGAVSVERVDGAVRPWRLPHDRLELYPAPGDALIGRAMESSGVRLRFMTAAPTISVQFLPLRGEPVQAGHSLDLTLDGELVATTQVAPDASAATFTGLPAAAKVVEVWLPHTIPIEITGLTVSPGCRCEPVADARPRWVTYGSSLTHCRRAHSPARTWPAIVARRRGLHLTSLGFGGNCCLEPMLGMTIRDLPADFISLKLGINCIGNGALSARTFKAAVIGLVQIIRERHPDIPLALISPIGYPPHETTPNVLGYTIQGMREDIEDAHGRLARRGDGNLFYFDGLELFNLAEIARYAEDQCHPDADGIELMAEHFLERVAARIPLPRTSVDVEVRGRAEAFATQRGKSISRLVEEYLQFINAELEEPPPTEEPSA